METVLNRYHIPVRKWCASCEHKEVDNEGTRICSGMMLKVPQDFICPKWQMSDGMKNAGKGEGVVRLNGTTETIIH
jgi:hypothetical protein